MTDDKERPGPAGDQDPTEPIRPSFPAPGGITGGSVPPAEPIPNAPDPFSATGAATPPGGPGEPPPGGPAEPPGNRAWWWALGGLVLLAIVAVGIWLATRGDADGDAAASPAPTPSATVSSPSPSEKPTPEPTTTTTPPSAGCAATETGTPAGASTHQIVDVDGDGRPDTAWLTGGADRTFGITTASGATFSAPVTSASPVPASAIVNLVAAGGGEAPIALVDVGREVLLFSVADCAVTVTQNAQGQPYTFDKGFSGFGTGVGCTAVDGVLHLAGLNATSADGTTYTVERTFVDLDQAARKATNGQAETVAEDAAAADPVVVTAQETSCGDLVAGGSEPGGPVEPQG
ncbi:hypothetical protein ACFRCR_07785 [Oerskovia sp. NPDC056781]|uniref:hypothetical protein n=1 Tax=Oerskovia sp. NPDC056781 TaxID=3345942 RepID=UPI00366EF9A7